MSIETDQDFATVLASRYLPVYQFSERHEIAPVRAEVGAILGAVKNYDDRQDPILDFLLKVRELPGRTLTHLGASTALRDRPRFGLTDFLLLGETANEVVFGLVGCFWRPDFGLVRVADAAEFAACKSSGIAKLVMSYTVQPHAGGTWRLQTETRVWCPDWNSKLRFFPYWIAIRLASGWIRRRILVQVKRTAEHACAC